VTAGALALVALSGCGVTFHSSTDVKFVSKPEDKVVVYRDGAALPRLADGTSQAKIFLGSTGGFTATAPGKKVGRVEPEKSVDGLAIGLDALWCLTIVGVAAPISDAILGGFQKAADHVDVALEPYPETDNPMPTYAVGGVTISANDPPYIPSAAASSSAPPAGSSSAAPASSGSAAPATSGSTSPAPSSSTSPPPH
jgi:hypothetical protein